MHIKQIRLAMLASLLASASVFAAEPFVGPSVGLSLSNVHTNIDFSGYLNNQSMSSTKNTFDLNAGYGLALAPKVVLNAGMSINLDQPSLGTHTYSNGTETVNGKVKDRWSLSLAPGYLISPKLMAYGKVAYQYANIDISDSYLNTQASKHFHGWGYGLGVAYAPVDHLETSLEVSRTKFSTQQMNLSSGAPEMTAVTLGASYRF